MPEVMEKLKRVLLSGYTEPIREDVADFLDRRVAPLCFEMAIEELSVILVPKDAAPVKYATGTGTENAEEGIGAVLHSMQEFGASCFSVCKEDYSYVGYSENDLDWVVLKVAVENRGFAEELIDSFWYQFFENA